MGIEKGIAAGKGNVPTHIPAVAKTVEVFEDRVSFFKGHGLPVAPVITVFAVKVAGLGHVPLKGKGV